MQASCRACRKSLEKVDEIRSRVIAFILECYHSNAFCDMRISTVQLQQCRSAGTITGVALALGETEAPFAMMGRSDGPGEDDMTGRQESDHGIEVGG